MFSYSKPTVKRFLLMAFLVLALSFYLVGCSSGTVEETADGGKETIVLGDASWDSIQVHNRIVGFVLEKGYGYSVDYIFGETLPIMQGLANGDVDIYMEVWVDNIQAAWEQAMADGVVEDLGIIFPDAPQGWYVPTYMIKGDPERGIEPVAPDLESVFDLPKYKELFQDPEEPTKGRFHNSPPGWVASTINEEKFDAYDLNEDMNLFSTGSDTALVTSMVNAYEKGEPWVGYYWEPTWVMGKLDMTILVEPPYEQEIWDNNKGCAYPNATVLKGINKQVYDKGEEIVSFVEKYETTLEQNNELLAYMDDHGGDTEKAALYFLESYPEVWKEWLPGDIADKVSAALEEI